jgi:hypothetical protein
MLTMLSAQFSDVCLFLWYWGLNLARQMLYHLSHSTNPHSSVTLSAVACWATIAAVSRTIIASQRESLSPKHTSSLLPSLGP